MFNLRTLLATGLICAAVSGSASAQAGGQRVSLAGVLASSTTIAGRMQGSASPLANLTIRGGAMVTPRGAGLAGVDFDLPSFSFGNGWHGRLDADVIFTANFGGINTAVPVTVDQIYVSPNAAGEHNIYWGGGLGAVLGGRAVFDGKLILGVDLTKKLGAEVNVHFTERDTLVCLVGRLHL
jgi:hypothetical protein